jgi:HTH-type transcriptional regulator/antitoxin HigA
VLNDYRTPGQLVEALLIERGFDKQVLAAVLGVDNAIVSRIISGKKRVDAELAIALSEVLETPPERFMDLQQAYDLATARTVTRPDTGRAHRAALLAAFPVAEMGRRGWLKVESVRDFAQVEAELAKFFGVATPAEIEIFPHAAKRTNTAEPATPSQLAWIQRVQQIASDMVVPAYSRAATLQAIENLKLLLRSAEEARKVPRILAEAGIRFVLVEPLKSAKIDGVCVWLDDISPVIGMSLRFDRIDNFWFVLRHELEHVLREHGRTNIMLDDLVGERAGTSANVPQEERAANEVAADFCVPARFLDQFIARKAPLFTQRDMLGFANTIQVHPGLVAGQLQQRTDRYDLFREHLVKIRSIIAPSAMVDGWGDIAPTRA